MLHLNDSINIGPSLLGPAGATRGRLGDRVGGQAEERGGESVSAGGHLDGGWQSQVQT